MKSVLVTTLSRCNLAHVTSPTPSTHWNSPIKESCYWLCPLRDREITGFLWSRRQEIWKWKRTEFCFQLSSAATQHFVGSGEGIVPPSMTEFHMPWFLCVITATVIFFFSQNWCADIQLFVCLKGKYVDISLYIPHFVFFSSMEVHFFYKQNKN